MVMVPRTPTVEIRPDSTPFQSNAGVTPDAFGANVAAANEQAGKQLGAVGDKVAALTLQKQAEDNERQSKTAHLSFKDTLSTSKNQYLSLNGQEALDQRAKFSEDANRAYQEHLKANAGNKVVTDAITATMQESMRSFNDTLNSHNRTQKRAVDVLNYDRMQQDNVNTSIDKLNDPGALNSAMQSSRILAADEAKERGIKGAKNVKAFQDEAEAVVVRETIEAAVKTGKIHDALRIYHDTKGKIKGKAGADVAKYVRDQTTDDVANSAAQAALKEVEDLPIEDQPRAVDKILSKITDVTTLSKARGFAAASFKRDQEFRALELPKWADNRVQQILDGVGPDGKQEGPVIVNGVEQEPKEVGLEEVESRILEETKPGYKRDALLFALKFRQESAVRIAKDTAEITAREIYTLYGNNLADTTQALKDGFAGDEESLNFALEELNRIHKIDQASIDIPRQAADNRDRIIQEADKALPNGNSKERRAFYEQQVLKIENPQLQKSTSDLLSKYSASQAGVFGEQEANEAQDLFEKLKKGSLSKTLNAINKSSASAAVKKGAKELATEAVNARTKDRTTSISNAMALGNKFINEGGNVPGFQKEHPDQFALILETQHGIRNLRSAEALKAKGEKHSNVSAPDVEDKISKTVLSTSDEDIANINLDEIKPNVTEKLFIATTKQKIAAKRRIEKENKEIIGDVPGFVTDFQPRLKSGKPALTKEQLSAISKEIEFDLIKSMESNKKPLDAIEVKNFVVASLTRIKSNPHPFWPNLFLSDEEDTVGGKQADVAARLLPTLSKEQRESVTVPLNQASEALRQAAKREWVKLHPNELPDDDDLQEQMTILMLRFLEKKGRK